MSIAPSGINYPNEYNTVRILTTEWIVQTYKVVVGQLCKGRDGILVRSHEVVGQLCKGRDGILVRSHENVGQLCRGSDGILAR